MNKPKKQSLEEFIDSQPLYAHCTTEYLEGIEVGAKWQEEQAKEMEKEQSSKMPEYDLDELAMEECNNPDLSWENDYAMEKFKAGFQKALELLTFKSE